MIKFIDTLDCIVSRAAFLAFVPVILKFASKRLKLRKADRFLMKIHEPAGKAALVLASLHALASLTEYAETGLLPYLLGLLCLASTAAALLSGLRRQAFHPDWRRLHRIFTVVFLLTFVLHILLAKC